MGSVRFVESQDTISFFELSKKAVPLPSLRASLSAEGNALSLPPSAFPETTERFPPLKVGNDKFDIVLTIAI